MRDGAKQIFVKQSPFRVVRGDGRRSQAELSLFVPASPITEDARSQSWGAPPHAEAILHAGRRRLRARALPASARVAGQMARVEAPFAVAPVGLLLSADLAAVTSRTCEQLRVGELA